ncbi:hypothetical protein PAQ31011_05069 [Pandoraea aquatica]|uniref:Glycosyltransferase RgtA/B/C/D-like domain-containing protein n=1 Tax=Pandoraea aquatica TaxID=2508290 RepID=A0A5E4Z6D9_9BURK|nr:hypothetical protein [Pandoraea aquatica]VVE56005.1 hypothetical protein PAQ31011_05069 [Pandoraea aquatica]
MRKAVSGYAGDIAVLFVVYALAYGLMLLNHGIYWDDWVWFDLRPDLIKNSMSQLGYPFLADIHLFLQQGGVFAYRLLTFACYLVAAIALYGTLAQIPSISRTQRLFITIIFAVFPVNGARILIATVHYAIAYVGFFVACFAFVSYINSRRTIYGVIAWLLFFASTYLVNSLLVFYGVLPIYLLYLGINDRATWVRWRAIVINNLGFLVLPLLVFLAKQQWGKPYGLYDGYNTISLKNALLSLPSLDQATHGTLIDPVNAALLAGGSEKWLSTIVIVVTVGICVWIWKSVRKPSADGTGSPSLVSLPVNLLVAVVLLGLAVLPYLVVGKMPAINSWETRHQLLVPLGAAWLFVAIASVARRATRLPVAPVLALLCGLFVASNIRDNVLYIGDAFKQDAFMLNAAQNPDLRAGGGQVFSMRDTTTDMSWSGRCMSFYEYAGMFSRIFHEQSRLPIGSCELYAYDVIRPGFTASYHLADVKPGQPTREVIIERAGYPLSLNNTLRLLKQSYFEPKYFEANVRHIVNVRVVPYTGAP